MPTESDLTGVLPQSQMAERSSEPTSIGDRKLKPSTLIMGYGFDPVLSEGIDHDRDGGD